MINPLQHIPVVSYLYRQFTGDSIRPIGQIVGHEHVAPVRKHDPGPGFDWAALRRRLRWPQAMFAAFGSTITTRSCVFSGSTACKSWASPCLRCASS